MPVPFDQWEAMRRMGENWDGYGAAAPQARIIDLAREFASLLEVILANSSTIPAEFHANPTRLGGVLIDWEDGRTEHEVELNPDYSISFLHRDKHTGDIQTRKFSANGPAVVDPGLLEELRHLVAA